MEKIDLALKISGYASLGQQTREALRARAVLKPLPYTLEKQLLGSASLSDNCLRALIGECPVFVNVDWVVWIHGPTLRDCFAAMAELVNLISQVLETPVLINLLDTSEVEPGQLRRRLNREAKMAKFRRILLWGLGSSIVVLAGGLFTLWITC